MPGVRAVSRSGWSALPMSSLFRPTMPTSSRPLPRRTTERHGAIVSEGSSPRTNVRRQPIMSDNAALKDLLFRMADDDLIIAHRNSEWTGLGPILEEDIAFSSIAQDKLGHSQALYAILATLGEADPDTTAFTRDESRFRCCQFVEYPIGGYEFSLVRHFLFDNAELLRWEMLESSSFQPLAKLAAKIRGEI